MKLFFILTLICFSFSMNAQSESDETLPYYQIPEAPATYTSGNIMSRMIDGLGYRYFWATEGLTENDLNYKPSEDGRTAFETLEHLHGLSEVIVNAPQNLPNIRGGEKVERTYEELRTLTLQNFKKASDLLRGKDAETVGSFELTFQNGDTIFNAPYWNMINGPIGDALWHAGQLVVLRRASGNPIHPKVNVFTGKTGE